MKGRKNKVKKIGKRLHKLNAKELRQVESTINQIYIKAIKKELNELYNKKIIEKEETNNERTV